MRSGSKYVPDETDRRLVKRMRGCGLTVRQVAMLLNISPPTLRRHFRFELEAGELAADVEVINSVFKAATRADRPDMRAAALWLSRRPEWRPLAALGKKEQAELDALTTEQGTSWDGLLN